MTVRKLLSSHVAGGVCVAGLLVLLLALASDQVILARLSFRAALLGGVHGVRGCRAKFHWSWCIDALFQLRLPPAAKTILPDCLVHAFLRARTRAGLGARGALGHAAAAAPGVVEARAGARGGAAAPPGSDAAGRCPRLDCRGERSG